MVRIAPRYPDRLLGMIEALDDEELSLAEVARRVGSAAERASIVRPSSVHVRALVTELRHRREEDRAAREAAVRELTRMLPYAVGGNPYEASAAAARARARAEERHRRRRT